jgi:hypothetical protein
MAKKNTVVEENDDEAVSGAALDALMDTDWDNMPEVMETIPTGTWKLRVRNAAYKEASGDQNAKFLFFYIPAEPMNDVDPEALEAAGADYDFTNNQIVYTKYVENLRDLKAVMQIVQKHGVDLSGLNPKQAIKKLRGKEVVASVGTRSYKNRFEQQVTENTVTNFATVDEYEASADAE